MLFRSIFLGTNDISSSITEVFEDNLIYMVPRNIGLQNNLNAKTGRLSLNTSLGVNHAYPQNSQVRSFNSSTESDGSLSTVSQDGFSKWSRVCYNGSAGLDYDFNNYHNISSTIKINRFSNGGPGSSAILTNGYPSTNIRDMDMGFNNLDWNIDYRKTSKKEGEEFSVSAQLTTGRNTSDYSNRTVFLVSLKPSTA